MTGRSPLTWQKAAHWLPILKGEDQAILHLHGHWRDSHSVVLGIRSYEEMMGEELAQHVQRTLASLWSLVFIGCSGTLKDPNFSALVDRMGRNMRSVPHQHFLILRKGEPLPIPELKLRDAQIITLRYDNAGLLDYIRSLAPQKHSGAAPNIFLAYAPEDNLQVQQLYTGLKKRGLKPWIDEQELKSGQSWNRGNEIRKAIREAKLFLACLSSQSIKNVNNPESKFREALAAFGERTVGSIYLIPIRLDSCEIPDLQIPGRNLNLRDVGPYDPWRDNGFDTLVSTLKHNLGDATSSQTSQKEAPSSPPPQRKLHRNSRSKQKGNAPMKLPEMEKIFSGSFWMGSNIREVNRDDDEGPQHMITMLHSFFIGRYPVTFDEYELFASATCRELPSDEGWGRGRRPVINVTWEDAKAYTKWLSEEVNQPYRLLSEAEWEYACRAGTTTRYWWGNDIKPADANWAGSHNNRTTDVDRHSPNSWGLYDMHGNVREWLEDAWHDSYEGAPTDGSAWMDGEEKNARRVTRGGAWVDGSLILRSACRNGRPSTDYRTNYIGFRIAKTFR